MAVQFLQDTNINGTFIVKDSGGSNELLVSDGLTRVYSTLRLDLDLLAGASYGTSGQVLTSNGVGNGVSWETPTTIVDNYARTAYIVLDSGTTGVTRTADSPSTGYTKFTLTPSTWFTSIYNNTRGFIVQVVDASTGQIVGAEIDLNTGTNDRIDIIFKGNVANSDFDANIVYTGVFGIA